MDLFKKKQFQDIGPGGFHCPCCNRSRGKTKNSHKGQYNLLNKRSRKKLKNDLRNELKDL